MFNRYFWWFSQFEFWLCKDRIEISLWWNTKMRLFLALFALFLVIFTVGGDIVEKNGICVEEIKALEKCLNEAGQGQGWCGLGNSVNFAKTSWNLRRLKAFDLKSLQILNQPMFAVRWWGKWMSASKAKSDREGSSEIHQEIMQNLPIFYRFF